MMTKPPQTRPPDEGDVWEESSSVLPKQSAKSKSSQSGEFRVPRHDIDELVRMGQALLEDLPVDHPRGRMLRLAILRHDEVLLSGLIAELSAAHHRDELPDTVPPPRRGSVPDSD